MRIGIYVDVAKEIQPRGIGYHVIHLLKELSRVDHKNKYLLYYQCGLWQDRLVFPHCPKNSNFQLRPVRTSGPWQMDRPRLWWDYYLPLVIRADRLDVFHGPSHMLPSISRNKNVVTIHDVAYFTQNLYSAGITAALRDWTQRALDNAGRVIALSENTRRDLEQLGVNPKRIRVIYGGGNVVPENKILFDRKSEVRQTFKLPEHYILFVGVLHPRKNVPFLLQAFARLKKERQIPHGLVLVGKKDTAFGEIEKVIRELGIESDVIITGYVEEWQMPLLYKMADVFVLPTLYEGFTLVTLEAMAYGTPVISTDTSSIREGVGDAALLVPVNDVEKLTEAIDRILTDDELRRRLVEDGKAQAQKFSWENCARQTIGVYEELYRAQRAAPLRREKDSQPATRKAAPVL